MASSADRRDTVFFGHAGGDCAAYPRSGMTVRFGLHGLVDIREAATLYLHPVVLGRN